MELGTGPSTGNHIDLFTQSHTSVLVTTGKAWLLTSFITTRGLKRKMFFGDKQFGIFSKSVLDIKTRLVVTVELGTKWMPNSDSASNFMPEYKLLG